MDEQLVGVAPGVLERGLAAGELWWHSFPEDRARPLAANQNWSVEGQPTAAKVAATGEGGNVAIGLRSGGEEI
jgi:hypothetical protein